MILKSKEVVTIKNSIDKINKNQLLLCILDGWGYSPNKKYNAIHHAKTPYYDSIISSYPHSLLKTSGKSVGLPHGQMGNSEVGHMTIGSGRTTSQNLVRINEFLEDQKLLQSNNVLNALIKKTADKTCHVIALTSDGGVHSHIEQVIKIGKYLRSKKIKVVIHAFTDGRDTKPKDAVKFIDLLLKNGFTISSVSGRYFAMDRDKRWERTQKTYDAIIFGQKHKYDNLQEYINQSYSRGINDEFIEPAAAIDYRGFSDGDSIFFANFRADRILQLINSIIAKGDYFQSQIVLNYSYIASISEYDQSLNDSVNSLSDRVQIINCLGECIANRGLQQLRIAETEKYAHVTYFFNGGNHIAFPGEDRVLIESPKVDYYDQQPEMAAYNVTATLLKLLDKKYYDFTCINFANADMVGHTGNFLAATKACEAIDMCLQKIGKYCLEHDIDLLITADHGNVEEMAEICGARPKTVHSTNDVPFIYVGAKKLILNLGQLSDIAPTILNLLELDIPKEMTGTSLIK